MTTPSNKTPSAAQGDDAPRRGRRRRLYASEPATDTPPSPQTTTTDTPAAGTSTPDSTAETAASDTASRDAPAASGHAPGTDDVPPPPKADTTGKTSAERAAKSAAQSPAKPATGAGSETTTDCATDAPDATAAATDATSPDDQPAERIHPLPPPEVLDAERARPSSERAVVPRSRCIRSPALRRLKARQAIHDHALLAGGAMAIPVPLVDLAAEAAIQVRMVHRLTEIYGLDFAEERAKALVAAAIGGFSTGLAANGVLRFASYLLNFWTSAAASAAITYGIGRLFMHHFERGGRLEDLCPKTAARTLRQEGRSWRGSARARTAAASA